MNGEVLSDVHVFNSTTKTKENNVNHTHITRFFFSLKDNSNGNNEPINYNDKATSREQYERICRSSFDADGDVVVLYPRGMFPQGEDQEVITIEHRLQTVLKDVGYQVWLGSLLLCDYLIANRDSVSQHSVLDLGAGTGLASIVAAMFAKSVVCTDYKQEIVDLAEENWKRNLELLPLLSLKEKVTFQVLDWTSHQLDSDTNEDAQKFFDASLIIAAEVVYDEDLTDAFFRTIYYLLKRPPAKMVIVSLEKRIVFDSAWQDVCSPAYLHFQENLNDLCSVDQGNARFECQRISTEHLRRSFLYDRTAQLELWKITSKFEDKDAT